MSTMHYRRDRVPGIWQPERGTACGYGMTGPPSDLPVTADPAEVTCGRCRKAADLDPDSALNRVTAALSAAGAGLTATQLASATGLSYASARGVAVRLRAAGRVTISRTARGESYRLRDRASSGNGDEHA